jgi:hypothetical protein
MNDPAQKKLNELQIEAKQKLQEAQFEIDALMSESSNIKQTTPISRLSQEDTHSLLEKSLKSTHASNALFSKHVDSYGKKRFPTPIDGSTFKEQVQIAHKTKARKVSESVKIDKVIILPSNMRLIPRQDEPEWVFLHQIGFILGEMSIYANDNVFDLIKLRTGLGDDAVLTLVKREGQSKPCYQQLHCL